MRGGPSLARRDATIQQKKLEEWSKANIQPEACGMYSRLAVGTFQFGYMQAGPMTDNSGELIGCLTSHDTCMDIRAWCPLLG